MSLRTPFRALVALFAASVPLIAGARAQDPDALPPGTAGPGVTLVRIEGPLNAGTLALLRRAIDQAAARDDHLVIELDTPGGEVELMWQLANAIDQAALDGTLTVAWVNDRALSAGALLALACERLFMRPHATIGAALPVAIGPGGLVPTSPDEEVREKLSSALRSEFRGIAGKHGKPTVLAEAMVDPDVTVHQIRLEGEVRLVSGVEWSDLRNRADVAPTHLRTVVDEGQLFAATGTEATELQLADGLAETLDEVIEKVGRPRVVPTRVEPATSETLAGLLYSWSPLLLILGLLFGYVEFKAPGFGVPGILAIVCFAALLFGRYLVGLADVPHIVLVAVGIVLLAVELFLIPGTTWVGALGLVFTVSGVGWSILEAGGALEYGLGRRVLLDEAFRFVIAGLVAAGLSLAVSRYLPRTPLIGRLVLDGPSATGDPGRAGAMPEAHGAHAAAARAGAGGRALTALRPVGKVVLDADPGLEFEARSDGAGIDAGTTVRVVEVQGSGRLVVAAAPDPADAPPRRPAT